MTSPRIDRADWSGIALESTDVGARNKPTKRFVHDGFRYVTRGEMRIAIMLSELGIAFTPNVKIAMPRRGRTRNFTPDFVFNRAVYLWQPPTTFDDDAAIVIHGIEAKGTSVHSETRSDVRNLWRQRNIRIIVLTEPEIDHWFERRKRRLPLRRGW